MADEGELSNSNSEKSKEFIATYFENLTVAIDKHQREIRFHARGSLAESLMFFTTEMFDNCFPEALKTSVAISVLSKLRIWCYLPTELYQNAIELATAGLAVLGVVVIGRTLRVFTTFRHVEDIPRRFVARHVRLQGNVIEVDDCATILTQHIPIVKFGRHSRDVSPLPITLSGIDVLGPGCTWLQHNLVGRNVWFQPVAVTQRNQLECIVIANMGWFWKKCINRELVARGLAFVRPVRDSIGDVHPVHPDVKRVVSSLTKAELSAERWRRGAWATPSMLTRFLHRPVPTARRAFYDNLIVSSLIRLFKGFQSALKKRIL